MIIDISSNKPDKRLSIDEEKILYEFNDTSAEYERDVTIHQLFERQVVKNSTKTAVIIDDKSMTYGELDRNSDYIAVMLRGKGVKADSVVGIMAERSLEMIVGIYGIIKAGGAYLPITPSNPEKRIRYMLEESNASILLVQEKYFSHELFNGEIINLEDEKIYEGSIEKPANINSSRDLAYVIFTSGSTGNPKGTMIEHRSLVNRLNWMQKKYSIGENDTIIQKTPIGFDVSVWEIFWWAIVGAKLCLLKPGHEKFAQAIVETIEKYNITIMHFVPSMLHVFLNYIRNSGDNNRLGSLRIVFSSGEALTPAYVKDFYEILYQKNTTKLINLYGPTEATIDVTYFDCLADGYFDKIPIGKPIDNIRILIVQNDRLQPIGEPGEICITGDGLARGYLNQPELTKKYFVQNPFTPGDRMYKTGDLGKWMPDGNIEYLGRIDFQVKIRGLRIELGEIEAAINSYSPTLESVVIVDKQSDTLINIIAYVATKEDISFSDLKKYLREILPDYMIPNKFIQRENMPFTLNGKIDRKHLIDLHQ